MTQQHPITPPPELVEQWMRTAPHPSNEHEHYHYITFCAAQWGSDQELDACCEWLEQQTLCGHWDLLPSLCAARRPKPPTLKQRAMKGLAKMIENGHLAPDLAAEIRAVVEMAPDE